MEELRGIALSPSRRANSAESGTAATLPQSNSAASSAAHTDDPHRMAVSPSLADYLQSLGSPTSSLTPAEAAQLLRTAQANITRDRMRRLPMSIRGEQTRRPAIPLRHRAGRVALGITLKKAGTMYKQPIHDGNGDVYTDPHQLEAALWATRKGFVEDLVPEHPARRGTLALYFRNRTLDLPEQLHPQLRTPLGLILRAYDASSGHDNRPYEVLHQGARFVAYLLAQGHWVSHIDRDLLPHLLGPNIDLLSWIPKKVGASLVSMQRPLAIPTSLRRDYAASTCAELVPAIEPLLSPHQAAVAGGSCSVNIDWVLSHQVTGPPPHQHQPFCRMGPNFRTCR